MLLLIVLFNALRFIGLEYSPPGFYADESYGATQVICLSQTGADFFGNFLPLFSISGPGEPIYTPGYLYGQIVWTSIFGYSIASFRGYPAFITVITVLFLFLYIKNLSNSRLALYVAFVASIMPWAFQFSRIAWDPPLAPFFLILGLWVSSLKKRWWLAGIPLALSIYSYPPLRIITPFLWLLIPGISLQRKFIVLIVMFFVCLPLAMQFHEENFFSRSNMLAIWSPTFYNPYRHYAPIELIQVFYKNWISHFSLSFLFLKGENNLRHSIQSFGMLSWLDAIAFVGIIYLFIIKVIFRKIKAIFTQQEIQLFIISLLGVGISIIPAALTNESSPHALRTISAWPFYAIFSGTALYQLGELTSSRKIYVATLLAGILFFTLYQYSYFFKYPNFAKEGFEAGYSNEILYPRLVSGEINCEDLRYQIKKMDRNTRIDEPIDFSQNGRGPITSYLNNHWYDREGWGIWSDGKNADLLIPTPHGNPTRIIFSLSALISPTHKEQYIEIWINDVLKQKIVLREASNNQIEVALPSKFNDLKPLKIEFRTPGAVSPIQAGISASDNRILGVGLRAAEFKH